MRTASAHKYKLIAGLITVMACYLIYVNYIKDAKQQLRVGENEIDKQHPSWTLLGSKNATVGNAVQVNNTGERDLRYEYLAKNCKDTPADDPELDAKFKCPTSFFKTFQENVERAKLYPWRQHIEYFRDESMLEYKPPLKDKLIPTFVTGASSNHYAECQGVIQDIHQQVMPHYNITFIFYDLGLTPEQRQKVVKNCKCEVRTFPFHKYPAHFRDLTTFAWKIVIIQTILLEDGAILWLDASARFLTTKLDPLFEMAKKNGIAVWAGGQQHVRLADPRMFTFFNEDRCLFRNGKAVEGNRILMYLTQITFEAVLRPLVACALTRECIAPPGSSQYGCQFDRKLAYVCCHRQDQAALAIIMDRVYQHSIHQETYFVNGMIDVKRGHIVKYF